jgi:hypothetical protein
MSFPTPTPVVDPTLAHSSAAAEMATKLRMLEKANQVLLDQRSKLEDSLHQRESELAKVRSVLSFISTAVALCFLTRKWYVQAKLDLEQENAATAVKSQELLNHIAQLTQQKSELESKVETSMKLHQNQKQTEVALMQSQERVKELEAASQQSKSKMQQQIDQLQKQLQEVHASTKQQEKAQQTEAISQLQHQLRASETAVNDKERLFEETLKQERLRAAQTVAQINGRCELLQKQLEEAQNRLNFEKAHNTSKSNTSADSQSAEVATLRALLEDSQRKLAQADDQIKERDSRISKLADELKSALQKQFPPSPQPQRVPPADKPPLTASSEKSIIITVHGLGDQKQLEELVSALEKMQQNRALLAQELAREMKRSLRLTTQLAESESNVRYYHSLLSEAGIEAAPLPSLQPVSVPADTPTPPLLPSESSSTILSDQAPDIETKSDPSTPTKVPPSSATEQSPERVNPASRLPPPSASKPDQFDEMETEAGSMSQQNGAQRGSWFGRLWGNGTKPPNKPAPAQLVV